MNPLEDVFTGLETGAWTPRETDTDADFKRFAIYLQLGPLRTIAKLCETLQGRYPTLAKDQFTLYDLSAQNDWEVRARAWDAMVTDRGLGEIFERQVKDISSVTLGHILAGRQMREYGTKELARYEEHAELQKRMFAGDMEAAEKLRKFPVPACPVKEAGALVQRGVEIERQALGMDIADQVKLGKLVPVEVQTLLMGVITELIDTCVPKEQQSRAKELLKTRVTEYEDKTKLKS